MPASKAALPKFKKKSEAPLWHKDMLLEEKRVQRGEHEPEVQRAQSFLTYRPNLDRKGWSMKSLICLDETSEVPLLEQLQRALNHGKVVARTLDLFREWDADKNGTVSRREFARAMGVLGVEDVSVAEALFDKIDKDGSGEISYTEVHRRLRRSGGYTATDALWNARRKPEKLQLLHPSSRAADESDLLEGVYDGNELPDIPIPSAEIATMASPRPQTESRAASPRWRSAHRTYSAWARSGNEAADMPTDWVGTSDFRRRANSKLPSPRATEQVGGAHARNTHVNSLMDGTTPSRTTRASCVQRHDSPLTLLECACACACACACVCSSIMEGALHRAFLDLSYCQPARHAPRVPAPPSR